MCDYTFDECIDLCTEDIFDEVTLEEAMQRPKKLSQHLLDTLNYMLQAAIKPSVMFQKFSEKKPALGGPHDKTIRFRRYGGTKGSD